MIVLVTFPVPVVLAEVTLFDAVAGFAVLLMVFLLFLILFEPGLDYRVATPADLPDSEKFLALLGALADAPLHRHSRVDVLTNGEVFYEAELAAIRAARRSVNLEVFIFERGEVGRRFLEVLTERARAGVKVKLVVDAIGSLRTPNRYFKELRAAGGQVEWYQPLRWYNFKRLNNRTHRDVIVVDGLVGFIGGAGCSDRWLFGSGLRPRWRDTMCRVEGDLTVGLQSAFAENWLEAAGEILVGDDYFPLDEDSEATERNTAGLVVISAPNAGRATRARVLFQMLLASARQTILIATPYFVPDRSARREICRAIEERGVKVKVITTGRSNNHPTTRLLSRRLYGELLRAGVEIHEYQPGMIHTKAMVIDSLWSVVGSTNYDNRSFSLNDEVNLAARNVELANRLEEDFRRDLAESHQITYDEWSRRPIWGRLLEWLVGVLQRQE